MALRQLGLRRRTEALSPLPTLTLRRFALGRGVFVAVLAVYLLLRLWLATLPGYAPDVQSYKRWAIGAARAGLSAAYETDDVDYPPAYLYVLYGIGELYLFFEPPDERGRVRDGTALTLLVKLPTLVFDCIVAALLAWIVGRGGGWGRDRCGPVAGRAVALIYLWNPAVLWSSAYWGQPDAVHTAAVVAAVVLLARCRWLVAGVVLATGALVKPLAAPFVPLAATAAGLAAGQRGMLRCAAGGLVAALLAFLPYLVTGRILPTVRKVLLDVEIMPFASVNSHNLWWILAPWKDANAALVAGLTPKWIGLTLFVAGYTVLLVRSRRWMARGGDDDRLPRMLILAAAVATWFFFVSTHMHENHLFQALPLLLAVAGRSRALTWLAVGCSAAVLLNTTLHDLWLPAALPGVLGAPSPWNDPNLGRPYTWTQSVGMFVNTLLVAAVALGTCRSAWREGR